MQNKKVSGFTLVELAVVLVIIGLIVAAVVSGRSIIEASETRAVMAEVRKHMQSFAQFSERYRAYPGDFHNASTMFKTDIDAAVNAANTPVNQGVVATDFDGDGNNQVEWSKGEGTKAWFHMQLAGLTDGTYSGQGTTALLHSNVPASNIGGGGNGYYIDYNTTMQNHLGLGAQRTGNMNNSSALSPQRAANIDTKLDDGKPNSGYVQAVNGTPNPSSDCVNASGGYNLGSLTGDVIACVLLVRLN